MAQGNAVAQRRVAGAHAIGQQASHEGNKLGHYVAAADPSDVAALGRSAMQQAGRSGDLIARQVRSAAPAVNRIASTARDETVAG
jgi:hypothetical protein